MRILGFDAETTGLSPTEDEIIEVGLVEWNVELKRPTMVSGFLVKTTRQIPEEVTKINGLTAEICNQYGCARIDAFNEIYAAIQSADAVCAHNGTAFDKPFFEAWCKQNGAEPPNKMWIDTYVDLPVPSGKLIHMAAEHGFLNPFPHMAATDVLTMLRILDTYDVKAIIERAQIPNVMVVAIVPYDDRDKAKARGYKWQPETKSWVKAVKENEVAAEREAAGFKVMVKR